MSQTFTSEELLKKISDVGTRNYWFASIPSEIDYLIDSLIALFIKGTEGERNLIRSKVDLKHSGPLFNYSERMAALGVRLRSKETILNSLLALVIENLACDPRDSLARFALSYNSADLIGVNPDALFTEAASFATNEVSQALINFLKRRSSDKDIRAMGYKAVMTGDGLLYIRDF